MRSVTLIVLPCALETFDFSTRIDSQLPRILMKIGVWPEFYKTSKKLNIFLLLGNLWNYTNYTKFYHGGGGGSLWVKLAKFNL